MTRDPVCCSDVDELEATSNGLTSDQAGRVYFFCSRECKERFERDPGAFMGTLPEWEESDLSDRSWPIE